MLSVCGWYSRAATIHLPGATIRENGEGNGEEKENIQEAEEEKIQEEEKEKIQEEEEGVHVYKKKNGGWRGRWRRERKREKMGKMNSINGGEGNREDEPTGGEGNRKWERWEDGKD